MKKVVLFCMTVLTMIGIPGLGFADDHFKYSETLTVSQMHVRYVANGAFAYISRSFVFQHNELDPTKTLVGKIDGVRVCGRVIDISTPVHKYFRFNVTSCRGEEGHGVLVGVVGRLEYFADLDKYTSPQDRPLPNSYLMYSDDVLIGNGNFIASFN